MRSPLHAPPFSWLQRMYSECRTFMFEKGHWQHSCGARKLQRIVVQCSSDGLARSPHDELGSSCNIVEESFIDQAVAVVDPCSSESLSVACNCAWTYLNRSIMARSRRSASCGAHCFVFRALVVIGMLWVCDAAPVASTGYKRPANLTFYLQQTFGTTVRTLVSSSDGALAVLNQPLTATALPTSPIMGWQYGSSCGGVDNNGTTMYFLTMDIHINTTDYQGTFLIQGAGDFARDPTNSLAVVGGTGDFSFARGTATTSRAATYINSVAIQYQVQFQYEPGS